MYSGRRGLGGKEGKTAEESHYVAKVCILAWPQPCSTVASPLGLKFLE